MSKGSTVHILSSVCYICNVKIHAWYTSATYYFSASTAGELSRYVQQKLSTQDLWHSSFGKVKELMRAGHMVCERWIQVCDTLTTQFWKRYAAYPWKGGKFVPEDLVNFAARLDEVT